MYPLASSADGEGFNSLQCNAFPGDVCRSERVLQQPIQSCINPTTALIDAVSVFPVGSGGSPVGGAGAPPTDTCTEIVREPGCGRCPVCARREGDFCGGVRAEVLRRSALLPANPTGSYRWSSRCRARGCVAPRWTRSPPLGARTPPGSAPAAVSDWTAPVVSSSINV